MTFLTIHRKPRRALSQSMCFLFIGLLALVFFGCSSEGGSDSSDVDSSEVFSNISEPASTPPETNFTDSTRELDTDQDGKISEAEWIAWVDEQQTLYPETSLSHETFQQIDVDQDGYITSEDGAFEAIDTNQDGVISEAEWNQQHPLTSRRPQPSTNNTSAPNAITTVDDFFTLADRLPADGELTASEFYRPPSGFERGDTDGDGQISADEWQGPEAAFTRLDADGDGFLTEEEFQARIALQDELRPTDDSTTRTVRDIFDAFDDNDDLAISAEEWGLSESLFDVIDTNDDNSISTDEFLAVFQALRLAEELDDTVARVAPRTLFLDLDSNQDGLINSDEWHGTDTLYQALDSDSDGDLSPSEFLELFTLMRAGLALNDTLQLSNRSDRFALMDSNDDGVISADEWNGFDSVFDRLDLDNDGSLTQDEFNNAL